MPLARKLGQGEIIVIPSVRHAGTKVNMRVSAAGRLVEVESETMQTASGRRKFSDVADAVMLACFARRIQRERLARQTEITGEIFSRWSTTS